MSEDCHGTEFYRRSESRAIQPGVDMTDGGYKFSHDEMEKACEIQSRVAAIDWQLATWRKKAIRARQRAQNPRVDLWDCLFEACDIIERQVEQIKAYEARFGEGKGR